MCTLSPLHYATGRQLNFGTKLRAILVQVDYSGRVIILARLLPSSTSRLSCLPLSSFTGQVSLSPSFAGSSMGPVTNDVGCYVMDTGTIWYGAAESKPFLPRAKHQTAMWLLIQRRKTESPNSAVLLELLMLHKMGIREGIHLLGDLKYKLVHRNKIVSCSSL